jgi:thioredoxin-related protein
MYAENKSKGMEVVSVNVRYPSETREEISQWLEGFGATGFIGVLNKTNADVMRMYGVSGTPTNVIIDREGNIVKKIVGFNANSNDIPNALIKAGLEEGSNP